MAQSYAIFIIYPDGVKGFIMGFDSEFGTPIVGFAFGPEYPKEYSLGLAERIVEGLQESSEVFSVLEIIPAGLAENYLEKSFICGR